MSVEDVVFLADEPLWAEFRARWRAGRPPRVVVHGGYGKGNLGDDAILEAILARLRREWPEAMVTVVCHGPAWVRATHGVPACGFASLGALRAIARADLYLIGGGGIVDRINTYSGFRRLRVLDPKGKYLFLAALAAQACGAQVSFYSVGTTSVPDPVVGWLARLAIGRADWVSLRDPLSVWVLRQLGVRRTLPVTPDPAHAIVASTPERARQILASEGVDLTRPLVVLVFRYVAEPDIDNDQTIAQVAQLTERLVAGYNAQVLFVPFGWHPRLVIENDAHMAAQVQARVRCRPGLAVLSRPYPPADVKGILGLARVCVAERLHAVLLAHTAGVPVVSVIYDDKVEQYAQMAGLRERIPLREFSAARALAAIDALVPDLKAGISSGPEAKASG